jgi:glucose-6-phosphate 1-dehydrogenase
LSQRVAGRGGEPFGQGLETAQSLNRVVHDVFDERNVYRIDHYLGTNAVENIVYFRPGTWGPAEADRISPASTM